MKEEMEVFLCYAREDEQLRKGLEKQLRVLQRQGLIKIWHDRSISPGSVWEREIDIHLNRAQIILLLVSPDFMDSEYCYSTEMKRAMQRHEQGLARVLPVILRPVYWQAAPFGKLQALPTDAKPVVSSSWHSQDEAFYDVAEGIRATIEKMLTRSQSAPPPLKKESLTFEKTIGQLQGEGEVFYAQEMYESALAAFEQILRIASNNATAYTWKAASLLQLKRYEEALAAYDQALRIDPRNAVIYVCKGAALGKQKRYEEALAAYDQALRIDPRNAVFYAWKAEALCELGRYAEVVVACDQAIHIDSNYSVVYTYKARALCELGRYAEVLEACDQAIRINPNDAEVYGWKAQALCELGRYAEAVVACDQAIRIDPSNFAVYTWKAKAISQQKKLRGWN